MGPANSIENLSPGLKSFFYKRGLWAEDVVIRHFKEIKLVSRRYRTPYAEVDLLFRKNSKTLLLVEVKTISNFDFLPYRISRKQKERLIRASDYIRDQSGLHVEMNWAFVTDSDEVLVIDHICG